MKRLFVLIAVCTLMLTGCQSTEIPVEATQPMPTVTTEGSQLPLLADLQPEAFSLVGPVWYWQGFQSMSDAVDETIVAYPGDYSFRLNPDGTAKIQADCNSGFSNYTSGDGSLAFEAIAITEMACPQGSLGNEFVFNLSYAATYVYEDGLLYLNLAMDAGDMIFSTSPEPVVLPFD